MMSPAGNEANAPRDPALEARLASHLGGARLGRPCLAFARVGSTMDIARALARDGAPEGTLVWAAQQTRGRGRLGRSWASPEGGLYCSMVVRPTRPPGEVPQLSLVAGLSAAEAIHDLTRLAPAIRWPNDLLMNGRKVAGILVEQEGPAAVIGFGVNVAITPDLLPDGTTSLAAAGATSLDPYHLTGVLCRSLQAWYDVWTARGFAPIREALRPWLIGMFGCPLHLTMGATRVDGVATDLDDGGRLLVRLDSGIVRAFDMGTVSLLR